MSRLLGWALRERLAQGYTRSDLRSDVLAGMVVGVVALPLSMALGIAVGVPPQNGLYTAIVAGFVVAALGGCRQQVSGPTASFVILAPVTAHFGPAGLLLAGLMAGLILVAVGWMRLGKLIQFVPHPVTTGLTAGIGVVIATLQLKDFLGLRLSGNPQHFVERIQAMWLARGTFWWPELLVGCVTLATLLLASRVTRKIPSPLVALPVGTLLALGLLHGAHLEVATIASRFHTVVDGETVSGIPRLPPLPTFPWLFAGPDGQPFELSLHMVRELLPSAFAIAMLGAIESLLSAVVADGMSGSRHQPDAELIALGVGNIVAPFFGGIPATGALARTATNIRSGAQSPIAAMTHALVVLAAVVVLAPLIGYVPMSSLAALLLVVAWNMADARHFVHTARVAPQSDVMVLLVCFVLTVVFDMVTSVTAGVVLAALLFMRRMADVTEARLAEGDSLSLVGPLPPGVAVYHISGPLFFGAAQKAMGALSAIADGTRVIVLEMSAVPAMDATGLVALESALTLLRAAGKQPVLVGAQLQPERVMRDAGLLGGASLVHTAPTLAEGLERARVLAAAPPAT